MQSTFVLPTSRLNTSLWRKTFTTNKQVETVIRRTGTLVLGIEKGFFENMFSYSLQKVDQHLLPCEE